jgi:hypothetical protein
VIPFHHIDQIYLTIRTLIRVGGGVVAAYFLFDALKHFAGKSTDLDVAASLMFSALVDLKVAILVSLAGAACAWAAVERMIRHRNTEKMAQRIEELEKQIDPQRTSSRLTKRGKTNPQDKER